MSKNSWLLKKEKSNNFDLSITSLNAAYAIDSLVNKKCKNIEYCADIKDKLLKGNELLELLNQAVNSQLNDNVEVYDPFLNRIVTNLEKIKGLKPSGLAKMMEKTLHSIKDKKYEKFEVDFFIDIYDAINEKSELYA